MEQNLQNDKLTSFLCAKLFIDFDTGAMELIAPGDRVRAVGGKLNGSQNGYSLLSSISFPNTFSLLITLRVEPKVSVLIAF